MLVFLVYPINLVSHSCNVVALRKSYTVPLAHDKTPQCDDTTTTHEPLLSSDMTAEQQNIYHDPIGGPNVSPSASEMSGVLFPSAVLSHTVLPHHDWMVWSPMLPFCGYCRMKKMRTAETATPESSAAERTSVKRGRWSACVEEEGRGARTVVLRPPREMTPPDDILEDEADDGPGDVVVGVGRGDETGAGEDDGEAGE